MGNQAVTSRKDLAFRSVPTLAGIICFVVVFYVTNLSHATFVLLVAEGVALFGLAAYLVWHYLKTPPE